MLLHKQQDGLAPLRAQSADRRAPQVLVDLSCSHMEFSTDCHPRKQEGGGKSWALADHKPAVGLWHVPLLLQACFLRVGLG